METSKKPAEQRRKPPKCVSMGKEDGDKVLDEPLLLQLHSWRNPSDLTSVDISSQKLGSAKEDDLEKFDCVALINAAENLLKLETFRKFPALRELNLSLNGLRNLSLSPGDFLRLERLDLSYNRLSPQDVWSLGSLSQLRVLHLTANGLSSLPTDLAGSWHCAQLRFPALEVLSLDDNLLADPEVFLSLAHLCRLQELNLDRNRISAVPYLQQAEGKELFLQPTLPGGTFRAQWFKCLWQPPGQQDREVPEVAPKRGQLEGARLKGKEELEGREFSSHPGSQDPPGQASLYSRTLPRASQPPFPRLQHLSLAFNKVTEAKALLPVAFFPCLQQLTFHSNPLSSSSRGLPPLLTQLLQHHLGIKLVHQKSLGLGRWHCCSPLKATYKVPSQLPRVQRLPKVLEAPAEAPRWAQPPAAPGALSHPAPPSLSQPLPQVTSTATASSQQPREAEPRPAEEDSGAFFITQVEDVSKAQLRASAEGRLEKRSEEREEGSSQEVPECYKGYEELLGGDSDPGFPQPLGLQQKVQALHHLLRYPWARHQAARAGLGSQQESKRKQGRVPRRAEVLDGILLAMRNTSSITQVPLASLLQQSKASPRPCLEVQRLRKEFQEVFEVLSKLLQEEMPKPLEKTQLGTGLPGETRAKQSLQQLPGKGGARKGPKVLSRAQRELQ
ncbi:X-ray radiation resistance-associated protein 1 [Pogoniulus pusillus]|uniref:X-ray radiation resistance-associated protein 1 n=1 Tax=Pogoniulus pusillus TaxID=488313 RepID=UPI0030B979AF